MRRKLSILLLVALLNAGLHSMAHLSDNGSASHPVISNLSQGTSDSSGNASFGNNHTCLACQSLQHLQVNTPAPLLLTLTGSHLLTDWRVLPIHPDVLGAPPSDRAPPLA